MAGWLGTLHTVVGGEEVSRGYVRGPRFATGIQHMKQFAHNWHVTLLSVHEDMSPAYKIISH